MTEYYETIKRGHNPSIDKNPTKEYSLYKVCAGVYRLETPDYDEAVRFYDAHPMMTRQECLYGVILDNE